MDLKVGDKVRFLDSTGEGVIVEILDGGIARVEDEHGFDDQWPVTQIVKVAGRNEEHVAYNKVQYRQGEKEADSFKPKKYPEHPNVLLVDLHAERMISNPSVYSKDYILDLQMNTLQKAIETAKRKQKRELIVVHGDGSGFLKKKVREVLDRFPEIREVIDAPYDMYGNGATQAFL